MSDMKASVTLELIEKGFEKAEKAAKSLDKLNKVSKKSQTTQKAQTRTDDNAARNTDRATRAEERRAWALKRSTEAMRRQRSAIAELNRQERRLDVTRSLARSKETIHGRTRSANAVSAAIAAGATRKAVEATNTANAAAAAVAAGAGSKAASNNHLAGIGTGAAMAGIGKKAGGLGMAFAGGLGLGITGGVGLLGAAAVKGAAADEWERSQLRVLGEISAAQMRIHRKALDFTGAKRGVGTKGAYGVFGGLMAGGLSDSDAAAMTDSVIIFAKATQASTEDATRSTVALRNNMGITADKMLSAYDAIALGGKAGEFEVEDMAKSLPAMLAKMARLGEAGESGVRNTVAMAQAIRKGVGTSDQAATQFERMLETFTSSRFNKAAKKVGIDIEKTMKDAKDKGISPVFAILQKLHKVTKGNENRLSELIPESNASAAVSAVLKDIKSVLALLDEMDSSSGTVMNDYVIATDNANEAWSRFSANVTTKSKNLAEVTLPAVTAAMNAMSSSMEAGNARTSAPDGSSPDVVQAVANANKRGDRVNRFLENLFGMDPSEESIALNKSDARKQYQNLRNAKPDIWSNVANVIPSGRDFTDVDGSSRVDMVPKSALNKGFKVSDIIKSIGGYAPESAPGTAPIPTSRDAIIRASGMDIEAGIKESGIKAEAAARNTAGSIETILNSMNTYAAGLKAGNQFASGLRASSDQAAAAANAVANSVAGHFPQSPAKVGPLRNLPQMGAKISAQLAAGMDRNAPMRAANDIAAGIAAGQTTQPGNATKSAGGRGPITINLGGVTISGVSDPAQATDMLGERLRRKLDGALADVGYG